MSAWILFVIGVCGAVFGTTVAVAAAAIARIDLTRWIARRLRGATISSTLLASPGRLLRRAAAIAALGLLMAGYALPVLLPDGSMLVRVTLLLGVAVPLTAVISYALPRVVGQRWSEPVVRKWGRWVKRLTFWIRPLHPHSEPEVGGAFAGMLRGGGAEDLLEPAEASVIAGVLDFNQRPVRDVMTARTNLVAQAQGMPVRELSQLFAESGYARIPVYRDTLDNIVGLIYAFDLLKLEPGGELPLRPVLVTPGSKPCAELLMEMQRERRQMAVVLDEFGGTDGIVTLEDLLEVLVGEIFDETDSDRTPVETDIAEFDGATASSEVAVYFGAELPGDLETIGGFLAREAGRIPNPGDRFIVNDLEFDILTATPTRIERVSVRKGPVRAIRLTPDAN